MDGDSRCRARATREEVLREFDSGGNRLLEGRVEDVKVRMFDGFAVVTGPTYARGEYKGHAYDVNLRFTDVFVRRSGEWVAVSSHASRIAEART